MRRSLGIDTARAGLLLASSSVAALLIGGGASSALAAGCPVTQNGGSVATVSNASPAGNCIFVENNAQVTGDVSNTGTLTANGGGPPSTTGITISNSTVGGTVSNSGTISAFNTGIQIGNNATVFGGISNSGTIHPSGNGIVLVQVTTFAGGISNGGMIVAGDYGIVVQDVTIFANGITNTGTISAGADYGIAVNRVATFTGGISNGGTISVAGFYGIAVFQATNFSGGISNGGTISAVHAGIAVGTTGLFGSKSFTGDISNSGTITAPIGINIVGSTIVGQIMDSGIILATSHGISIDSASQIKAVGTAVEVDGATFTGGISNAGTITAANSGTRVGGDAGLDFGFHNTAAVMVSTFGGGIINAGTISAGNGIFVGGNADVSGGGTDNVGSFTISTFGGGISNAGTISAGGNGILVGGDALVSGGTFNTTAVTISTFGGGITNSGRIIATIGTGIWVGGNAAIALGGTDNVASVTISTFTGDITNIGTISAGGNGIWVGGNASVSSLAGGNDHTPSVTISTFGGSITNAGTIAVGGNGIWVGGSASIDGATANFASVTISTFGGGITNGGTIAAGANGIWVGGNASVSGGSKVVSVTIAAFSGGISNAGTISAGGNGILVGGNASLSTGNFHTASVTISTFGGITNVGTISAGGNGILVGGDALVSGGTFNTTAVTISTFSGGITNIGTITAGGAGILVGGNASVAGGIGNTASVTISTFGGNISNSGTITARTGIVIATGVTFAAGGAVVNSGAITGTGGTALDASTATAPVIINQNGGTITGTIKLSAFADQLNIAGGTVNGNIVGQGSHDTVNFSPGAGNTFTYGNNFTGINQVNINSGTVVLNGANSATNVDVFNATLAGTGTLDPLAVTIHSGATFAPGAPGVPGTSMMITGNVAFESGAIYLVQVNPSTATMANVTGSATLAGNVLAAFASGSYVSKQYDILHAGSLNGTFASLGTTNLPADFDASLTYAATDVVLDLSAIIGQLPGSGLNQNQQNVANGLNNFFNGGGALMPGFLHIFSLTGSNLANTLTQLDGEDGTGAERSAFDLMNGFLSLVLDPFVYGRDQTSGSGTLAFAPDHQTGLAPDLALAYADLLKAPPQSTFAQRWSAWASGFGGSGTANGDPVIGSTNVTTSTYGYAAGMGYHYSPDTVFGFALAGGGTNWNLAQGLGKGRSDAFQAGVYGTTHFGPAYAAAALAFANNWFTTNRTAMGDQLTANFQAQSYAARLEGGYRFAVPAYHGAVGVTPYAAVQAQDFHTPSYSETDLSGGGFGLTYNAMNGTDMRSELGSRFDDLTALGAMPLMLRAKVAWAHDWASNPALSASFESLPGTSFTVSGAPIPHDSALASAGAQVWFTPSWSFIAKFDGEFARASQTYAGSGTLRYTW